MRFTLILATSLLLFNPTTFADDWPTYNHDNHRSAVSQDRIGSPLNPVWVFESLTPPQPAWPDPARNDFFHRHYNLRSTVAFDRAFAPVGAGDRLYFGSSVDCKLYCLNANTGEIHWTFFTDAPIRLAPAVAGDTVYVASDDGYVYAVNAKDGKLLWKYTADEDARYIPGNGRLISSLLIRCGLVLDDDTLYFTAGLFPGEGAFLIALDARTGALKRKQSVTVSPQGYMLASDNALYVPTGRTAPVMFTREKFEARGEFNSAGGAYALLTDDILVTGPGRGSKEITVGDSGTRDKIATFGGLRMVIDGAIAYMQSETRVSAFNRSRYLELCKQRTAPAARVEALKKQIKSRPDDKALQTQLDEASQTVAQIDASRKACYLWTVDCNAPMSMILSGDTLFVGGEGCVLALDTKDGKTISEMSVEGKAHHLVAFNHSLYVSTDAGHIYRFANTSSTDMHHIVPQKTDNPYPADGLEELYAHAAEGIVRESGVTQGYCVVLDSQKGRLAFELAGRTELRIVAIESDPANIEPARKALDQAGLHGRVIVLPGPLTKYNFTSFIANLVVSDGSLTTGRLLENPEQIVRLIRPEGGVLCLGQPEETPTDAKALDSGKMQQWATCFPDDSFDRRSGKRWITLTRKPLPGAGQWTHLHADPTGVACSNDRIISGPVGLQWFGQPGPTDMIDRHHRNVAPLYLQGRLFIPGDCVIYAVDAYNGTVLYDLNVPESRRLGVFLDSSNIAVDESALCVAVGNQCLRFDPPTGRSMETLKVPEMNESRDWGYLACTHDTVFGSTCKPDASYTETSYDGDMALWYRNMKVVTSDGLFALDKTTGRPRWSYTAGLILNTTIVLDDRRVYFVETTNPKAMSDPLGRLPIKTLFESGEQFLTALDIRTGEKVYRKPIDASCLEEPVYLNCPAGTVLLSGSRLEGKVVRYYYYAFDASSGELRWSTDHDSELATDGGHGEYNRHPTIIGNTVYAWPYAYDLQSGERDPSWKFSRRGHGCGGVSASGNALFWRGLNPWMYDLTPDGGPMRLNTVTRPGCWINIIPAGGLVLIPEASSGCTCGFSLQTSLAYIPQSLLN